MVKDITWIEIEPLGTGRFRWNLFTGDVRVHSEVGRPETIKLIFETTAVLYTCPDFDAMQEGATDEVSEEEGGADQ